MPSPSMLVWAMLNELGVRERGGREREKERAHKSREGKVIKNGGEVREKRNGDKFDQNTLFSFMKSSIKKKMN